MQHGKGLEREVQEIGEGPVHRVPRESYFTAMVVVGQKEKGRRRPPCPAVPPRSRSSTPYPGGNGQRWLMVELEDRDDLYREVFG